MQRLYGPHIHIHLPLHLPLHTIGQRSKEVEPRDALHLVHTIHVIAPRMALVVVAINKADGLRRAAHAQYHLEESLGHHHLVLANGLVPLIVKDRSAHHVNAAIQLRPLAALEARLP